MFCSSSHFNISTSASFVFRSYCQRSSALVASQTFSFISSTASWKQRDVHFGLVGDIFSCAVSFAQNVFNTFESLTWQDFSGCCYLSGQPTDSPAKCSFVAERFVDHMLVALQATTRRRASRPSLVHWQCCGDAAACFSCVCHTDSSTHAQMPSHSLSHTHAHTHTHTQNSQLTEARQGGGSSTWHARQIVLCVQADTEISSSSVSLDSFRPDGVCVIPRSGTKFNIWRSRQLTACLHCQCFTACTSLWASVSGIIWSCLKFFTARFLSVQNKYRYQLYYVLFYSFRKSIWFPYLHACCVWIWPIDFLLEMYWSAVIGYDQSRYSNDSFTDQEGEWHDWKASKFLFVCLFFGNALVGDLPDQRWFFRDYSTEWQWQWHKPIFEWVWITFHNSVVDSKPIAGCWKYIGWWWTWSKVIFQGIFCRVTMVTASTNIWVSLDHLLLWLIPNKLLVPGNVLASDWRWSDWLDLREDLFFQINTGNGDGAKSAILGSLGQPAHENRTRPLSSAEQPEWTSLQWIFTTLSSVKHGLDSRVYSKRQKLKTYSFFRLQNFSQGFVVLPVLEYCRLIQILFFVSQFLVRVCVFAWSRTCIAFRERGWIRWSLYSPGHWEAKSSWVSLSIETCPLTLELKFSLQFFNLVVLSPTLDTLPLKHLLSYHLCCRHLGNETRQKKRTKPKQTNNPPSTARQRQLLYNRDVTTPQRLIVVAVPQIWREK